MDCPVLPHRDVSTHSRPKAAGSHAFSSVYTGLAFQHTAARRRLGVTRKTQNIELSFQHTAARRRLDSGAMDSPILARFQHTAARRRLGAGLPIDGTEQWFQHTAARRRLVQVVSPHDDVGSVSTHSRPKAAGFGVESTQPPTISFNTQPPEGGWQ